MPFPAKARDGESVTDKTAGHPLEWDLLDYVDGKDAASSRGEIEAHVAKCPECRERADGLSKLVQRVLPARRFLQPESADESRDTVRGVMAAARQRLDAENAESREAEEAIRIALATTPRPPISELPDLSVDHLQAAREKARALHFDPAAARDIVEWALAARDSDVRPSRSVDPAGARGMLLTTRASISRIEGYPKRALADLDAARPLLEDGLANPDIEIAYWWWIRAQAVEQRGEYEEALAAEDRAEQIYRLYGDESFVLRCQINRAITLSKSGRHGEAIEIHERLLSAGPLEPMFLEYVSINLAFDLVLANRFDEARARYAAVTQQLLRSGQEHRLIRVRAGLAEMARRERRFSEAIEIVEQLLVDYRDRGFHWDAVVGELDIASILCELGRFQEAENRCRAAYRQAVELGLDAEVIRALEVLAKTSDGIDRAHQIFNVRRFVRGFESNREEGWSAA